MISRPNPNRKDDYQHLPALELVQAMEAGTPYRISQGSWKILGGEIMLWETAALRDISEILLVTASREHYRAAPEGKYPFAKVGDISKALRRGGFLMGSAGRLRG